MKRFIFLLILVISVRLSAEEDINCPPTFCKIYGVPCNCNMNDYRAGERLDGENLELYLAVHNQTGLDSFTFLCSRFEPMPKKIRFSSSGQGCPFGLISYCHNIRLVVRRKGKWVVLK